MIGADAHAPFAVSLVATAPSPATTGTSLVVTTGEGQRFPAAPFNAFVGPDGVLWTPGNTEEIRVTSRATDTLTIVRSQGLGLTRTIVVGDRIHAGPGAKWFTDIEGQIAATNVVAPFEPSLAISTNPPGIHVLRGCRVTIPKTGTLSDLTVTIGAFTGALTGYVYDTGQSAGTHTTRTAIWTGSSLTPSANGPFSLGNPGLAVIAGEQYDFAVMVDNATMTIPRIAAVTAGHNLLPAGYRPPHGAGTCATKLGWSYDPTTYTNQATVTEANAAVATVTPLIIGMVT